VPIRLQVFGILLMEGVLISFGGWSSRSFIAHSFWSAGQTRSIHASESWWIFTGAVLGYGVHISWSFRIIVLISIYVTGITGCPSR